MDNNLESPKVTPSSSGGTNAEHPLEVVLQQDEDQKILETHSQKGPGEIPSSVRKYLRSKHVPRASTADLVWMRPYLHQQISYFRRDKLHCPVNRFLMKVTEDQVLGQIHYAATHGTLKKVMPHYTRILRTEIGTAVGNHGERQDKFRQMARQLCAAHASLLATVKRREIHQENTGVLPQNLSKFK